MPPVVVAVAGAAVAGAFKAGAITLFAATVAQVAITVSGHLYQQNQARAQMKRLKKNFAATPGSQISIRAPQRATAPNLQFAYGRLAKSGPLVVEFIKGRRRYDGFILNSRPSAGNCEIRVNGKTYQLKADANNDVHDMSKGAALVDGPFAKYCRFWIGLGDQTTPPQRFLDDLGDKMQDTDAGHGLTIMWVVTDFGPDDGADKRWQGRYPKFECIADWSRVYDPRRFHHSLGYPDTYQYSCTPALIALDLLLNDHTLNRPVEAIDFASFMRGAALEERQIAGTTLQFWECHTVIQIDSHDYQMLDPATAAAASVVRKSGGKYIYGPGADPDEQNVEIFELGEPIDEGDFVVDEQYRFTRPAGVQVTFLDEAAEYTQRVLPDIYAEDDTGRDAGQMEPLELGSVKTEIHARRLARAYLRAAARTKKITGTWGPEIERLQSGDFVRFNLDGNPYVSGLYMVESITPEFVPLETGGVALRHQLTLSETQPDRFQFTAPSADTWGFGGPM